MNLRALIAISSLMALCCLFSSCKEKPAQINGKGITHQLFRLDSTYRDTENADFLQYYDSIHTVHDSPQYMGAVVCDSFTALPYHKFHQNEQTNFITDALYEIGDSILFSMKKVHADFALVNYGGIRVGFKGGKLTAGDVFSMLSFDNAIAFSSFTGKQLLELFNRFAITDSQDKNKDQPYSRQLHITYSQEVDKEGFHHPTEFLLNGKKIDPNKTYWVVSIDFVLDPKILGDHIFTGIPHSMLVSEPSLILRDAIQNYMKAHPDYSLVTDLRYSIK